ncbi:hypothetical protein QYF61_001403 [Mycteria americana]|uniref:Uncharacterized protein n=1 Tax=Mycteria americana TaxID=33587 RepID=A0AAN7MX78_MYCAM|nr:hypothetical protein QYF61_001403 [Mycteria americana]
MLAGLDALVILYMPCDSTQDDLLHQLPRHRAIPTSLITGYQGEELSTSLSSSPPQKAVESNEVTPQPPFLPTRQAQSARPLLTGHAFQPFHQLCCPPLDAFKDLHILLKLWGPELPTALQGTLLTHIEPAVDQLPQTPFCRAALQPLLSQSICVPALLRPRCRIQCLNLLNFVPLMIVLCFNLSRSLCKASCPSGESTAPDPVWVISKLANGAFNPCIQIIDKYTEQNKPPVRISPVNTSPAEQPQLSQPFFIGGVFYPSDHLRGPPLDPLQQDSSTAGRSTPVGTYQEGVEGQNHPPRPAGHASSDAAQDTVGFLGCECTLLAHVQLFVHQYPQVLLSRASCPSSPSLY